MLSEQTELGDRRTGRELRAGRQHGRGARGRIAVVGAGASGTLAAVALLRHGVQQVELIDAVDHGLGVAYRTQDDQHLLNVPASRMSGLADEPDDFVRWCSGRGLRVTPHDYLPRRIYGAYLRGLLERFGGDGRLRLIRARVEHVHEPLFHGGVRLELADGRRRSAEAVVLALGNPAPAPLTLDSVRAEAIVQDPWARGALRRLAGARTIAVLGTGLSAVDVALTASRQSPGARIELISRHGRLPRAHLPGEPPAPRCLRLTPGSALDGILAAVLGAVTERPGSWREVVDGLRPRTSALWRGLSASDRARFEADLRWLWDIHRHRLAPAAAAHLGALRANGRLRVHAGGAALRACEHGGVMVALGDGTSVRADVLVNATGPAREVRASSNPLTRRLLANGMAQPDELGVGVATSCAGALISIEGSASRRCFTLGPPRRGELLESTAVPEIRAQAEQLATLLSSRVRVESGARAADAGGRVARAELGARGSAA